MDVKDEVIKECTLNNIAKMAVLYWSGVAVIIGAMILVFGL